MLEDLYLLLQPRNVLIRMLLSLLISKRLLQLTPEAILLALKVAPHAVKLSFGVFSLLVCSLQPLGSRLVFRISPLQLCAFILQLLPSLGQFFPEHRFHRLEFLPESIQLALPASLDYQFAVQVSLELDEPLIRLSLRDG